MKRTRARLHHWLGTARTYVGPMLLGVTLLLLSTSAFIYSHRGDLLIFTSQTRSLRAVRALTAMGASANGATDIFPEPALISYLHALQTPGINATEGREIAEALLAAGASVTERNGSGWTPLMLAASAGNVPVTESLLKHGAEVDGRAMGGEQSEGMTALMAAALHGHAGVVRLLLDHGANLQLRARAGFTAIVLAASNGNAECVELLIKKGAVVPPSTPMVAERAGHIEIAEKLRQAHPRLKVEPVPRRPAARYPEK